MRTFAPVLLIAFLQLLPCRLLAGGGPENVLLVVNGDSPISMQIANMYMHMRDIPPEHVLWLHDIPYPDTISIDTFRTRIWQPIRDFITKHNLDNEIDIVTYSAGFPYAVNYSADLKANKLPKLKYHGKIASLTGLTYFARHVESGSPYYLAGNANRYFRRNTAQRKSLPRPATEEETRLQKQAEKAYRKKDYLAALADYESLVRGFPEHGGLWHELARTQAVLGNHAEAITSLHQAVDHGWSNSTETRNDPNLKLLASRAAWPGLLDRMERRNGPFQTAHGFSASYEWTGATQPVKTFGSDSLNSHYLSTMLAFTGTGGNSVPEVKNYLAAARSSDGTRPDGTVYLMVNNNVRSRTRQPLFAETVAELERRGRGAEILVRGKDKQNGVVPKDKDDVIGAVVGSATFNWKASGSRLLPGAVAESLTSYGGILNSKGGQTKLTEFLRQGAAGSSGAVTEPYSIQAKFPVPMLHVHYADGCSLAEAFYQSVEAPYQLLIVGDPLARPFARFAKVTLVSPDTNTPWSGVVTLEPEIVPAADRPIDHLELWIDGQLTAYALADKPITWDTRDMDDGYHELRLVAQEADAIETRSYTRASVVLANSEHRIALDPHARQIQFGNPVTVSGKAINGREASLWQGNRKLATVPVNDGRWQLQIPSSRLGIGPVSLGVRVTFDSGIVVRSNPLQLEVEPPMYMAGTDTVTADKNKEKPVKLNGRLPKVTGQQQLDMSGQLKINRSGFFQLVLSGSGKITIEISNRPLLTDQSIDRQKTSFFPLALQEGLHDLKIRFTPSTKRPYLNVMLEGDQPTIVPEVRIAENTHVKTSTVH